MVIKNNCVFLSHFILCFCIDLVCYRGLYPLNCNKAVLTPRILNEQQTCKYGKYIEN